MTWEGPCGDDPRMDPDDELATFLTRYEDACAEAGVEPLPMEDLSALASAILSGAVAGMATLD